jgi:alkylation response protein AidB-like acyl-CoA dehydrogenase
MISFQIPPELELFQATARSFAQQKRRPAGRPAEAAGAAPAELIAEYQALGLHAVEWPEAVGGLGQGMVGRAVVEEELAAGDLALALAMPGPGAFGALVQALGTPAQVEAILGPMIERGERGAVAFSDEKPRVGTFSAIAEEQDDGSFKINGRKCELVLGDHAASTLVFARMIEKGGASRPAAFVVPTSAGERASGVRWSEPAPGIALDAAKVVSLSLEDVRVPAAARLRGADEGFDAALFEGWSRISVVAASRSVGLARAAFEHAQSYAKDRTAFGKPVAHFQAIAFLIADMATRVEVMRGLVLRAAFAIDEKEDDAMKRAAMALAEAHEGAMWVTNQAVQVLGGAGFVRDYPAEKWMREAKAHMAYALPHQTADLLVGRLGLDRDALRFVDDGPLPELQAVML